MNRLSVNLTAESKIKLLKSNVKKRNAIPMTSMDIEMDDH